MRKIEWSVPESNPWNRPVLFGRIGPLHVATVLANREHPDQWSVSIHLSPLPGSIARWMWTEKKTQESAKASAQRAVNAFTRILTGEGDRGT